MSYATTAQTTFDQMLGTLDQLLAKAAAADQGDTLMAARLAEDMFPLATQIRIVIYQALNTLNRLAGGSWPLAESDDTSLADARASITTARAALQATATDTWLPADTPVEFDLPNGMAFALTAHEYVRDWSLPQFYFHLVTAYAILRKEGLAIGKVDYMPYMMQHLKAPGPAVSLFRPDYTAKAQMAG